MLHMMEIYIIYLYADERYFGFFLFSPVDWSDLSKSTFEMHCKMLCHSFSSALKIIILLPCRRRGVIFIFENNPLPNIMQLGSPYNIHDEHAQ